MTELHDLAVRVVGWADDGEQLEVYASRGRSTSVFAYHGEVESLRSGTSQGLGIRIVSDRRQGFASAGSLDEEILRATLTEARENASLAEPDEHVGLAEPDGVPFPDIDLFDGRLHNVTDAQRVELALAAERSVTGRDARVQGVRTAVYGDGWGEAAIVSTTGVDVWSEGGSASVSVSPLAVDGEETQIGYAGAAGHHPDDLDLDEVGREAVERTVGMLGGVKPESRRVTALLEKRVVASLLGIVAGTLSGDSVTRGRSPFGDRMGEAIAVPGLTRVDDATNVESLAADIHDGEGLATRRNELIVDGVLNTFLYHTESARRAGATSTGSAARGARSTPGVGVQAMSFVPGDLDWDALIASVGEGVLIESVNGLHSGTNPVSGDISVGIQGHAIRNGQLAEPIREATIATTLQRLLLDIVHIGGDFEYLPSGTGSASLVVDGIALSGS